MEKEIKKNIENPKVRKAVKIIAAIVLALIIFKAGIFVGYRKAGFSYRYGENFYRTFGGQMMNSDRGMMGGFFRDSVPGGHGIIGKVIKISLPTIVVEGSDNIEKIITTASTTLVRNMRNEISLNDIKVDDDIVVIGSPTPEGQVTAKLIRILPMSVQK